MVVSHPVASGSLVQLSAGARLFSPAVIKEMARRGRSPLFARLVGESGLDRAIPRRERISRVFEVAFGTLAKHYRHEYIYKSAIAQKVLLGRHSLRTASMLTEFRVGRCKADVVILNGTSTAYEIKSDRDSLCRIESQVCAYLQVFAHVNVVTAQCHLKNVVAAVPKAVGIIVLGNRGRLSTVREAADNSAKLVPAAIFDALPIHESRKILEALGHEVPQVPNTLLYAVQKQKFVRLDPLEIHTAMVSVLKTSRSQLPLAQLISSIPPSLCAAAIAISLRKQDYVRLGKTLAIPMCTALGWT